MKTKDFETIKARAAAALAKSREPMAAASFEFREAYGEAELLADVPALIAEIERLRPIAKAEQLEQCDPNGTWYDVAQAALGQLNKIVKAIQARQPAGTLPLSDAPELVVWALDKAQARVEDLENLLETIVLSHLPALLRDRHEADKTDCNVQSIRYAIVRVMPGRNWP